MTVDGSFRFPPHLILGRRQDVLDQPGFHSSPTTRLFLGPPELDRATVDVADLDPHMLRRILHLSTFRPVSRAVSGYPHLHRAHGSSSGTPHAGHTGVIGFRAGFTVIAGWVGAELPYFGCSHEL